MPQNAKNNEMITNLSIILDTTPTITENLIKWDDKVEVLLDENFIVMKKEPTPTIWFAIVGIANFYGFDYDSEYLNEQVF